MVLIRDSYSKQKRKEGVGWVRKGGKIIPKSDVTGDGGRSTTDKLKYFFSGGATKDMLQDVGGKVYSGAEKVGGTVKSAGQVAVAPFTFAFKYKKYLIIGAIALAVYLIWREVRE